MAKQLLEEALVDLALADEHIDAARVKIQEAITLLPAVEPPVAPPPVDPVEPPSSEPAPYAWGKVPPALRTVEIKDGAELRNRLPNAQAGTRFRLAQGIYPGDYVLSANGEPTRPIFVEAPQGATFTGTVKIPGNWTGIGGVTFRGNGRKVDIAGTGGRVLRCTFDGIEYDGSIYLTGNAHPKAMIDFNKWKSIKGAAIRCEIQDSTKHKGMEIVYNHVQGHAVRGDNESVMLFLTDAYDDIDLLYGYNLFEDCMLGHEAIGQKELISVKTGGVRVLGNSLVGCRGGFISLRETRRCTVQANTFRDGSYVLVHGDDHVLEDNDGGSGLVVRMNAGDGTFDTPLPDECKSYAKAGRTPVVVKNGRCATAHCATRRAKVTNNKGKITAGDNFGDVPKHKASDIRADSNATAVAVVAGNVTGLTETRVGDYTQKAKLLTAAVVGPSAPAPA